MITESNAINGLSNSVLFRPIIKLTKKTLTNLCCIAIFQSLHSVVNTVSRVGDQDASVFFYDSYQEQF